MKWIGLMMIFGGSTLFGMMLDNQNRMRIKELKAFIQGFERLKGEVEYRLTPLAEGCVDISKYLPCAVGHVFRQFGCDLENRKSLDVLNLWQGALQKEKYRYHLKGEDYELLSEFGRRIGYLDKNMQQQDLAYIIKQLTTVVVSLEENLEKTTKLSTGLSILIGICICILAL